LERDSLFQKLAPLHHLQLLNALPLIVFLCVSENGGLTPYYGNQRLGKMVMNLNGFRAPMGYPNILIVFRKTHMYQPPSQTAILG
jgi:hypothetical protein